MNASDPHPTWQEICAQTLTCFRAQFQSYFPPILLVGAVAYSCIYGLQWASDKLVIQPSFESIMEPARFAVPRFFYAVGRASIWSLQLWVVWLVFTFVLATFAVKMLHERQPAGNPMRISEAFRLVRTRRLRSLFGISALAGLATGLFNTIVIPLLLRPLPVLLLELHLIDSYLVVFKWTSAALTVIFAGLLTKMALAVPELVDDPDASAGGGVRNSIKATAGWDLFFVSVLAMAGLISGIVYTVGSFFIEQSWQNNQLSSAGYEIALAAFTVVLLSLMIALLAITYSTLYVTLRYGGLEAIAPTTSSS